MNANLVLAIIHLTAPSFADYVAAKARTLMRFFKIGKVRVGSGQIGVLPD